MTPVYALTYMMLIVFFGYVLLAFIFKGESLPFSECLGLSLAVGAGAMGSLLFGISLCGFSPSRMVFLLIIILVGCLYLIGAKYQWLVKIQPVDSKGDVVNLANVMVFCSFSLLMAGIAIHALGFPLYEWDAFSIWGLKAKVLFYESLAHKPDYFYDLSLSFSHLDYPLGVPFLISGFYGLLGEVNDTWAKIIFPFYYLSLALILYNGFQWKLDKLKAACLVLITLGAGGFVRWAGAGTADLALTVFYGCGVCYLLRYLDDQKRCHLILTVLFAYFCTFTKNEGMVLGCFIVLVMFLFNLLNREKSDWKQFIACTGVFLGLLLLWLYWRRDLPRTSEDYAQLAGIKLLLNNFYRLKIILPAFIEQLYAFKLWGGIWVLLAVFAILGRKAFKHRYVKAAWLLLVLHAGLYMFVFIITPWDVRELLDVSLDRLILHFIPVTGLLIGLHWARISSDSSG